MYITIVNIHIKSTVNSKNKMTSKCESKVVRKFAVEIEELMCRLCPTYKANRDRSYPIFSMLKLSYTRSGVESLKTLGAGDAPDV